MRKLRLEQPFATMVVSGCLQTIPDKWGDVKVGEKILIYADPYSPQFQKEPLDYTSELDHIFMNELFFGNIPEDEYQVNEYLGYVIVTSSGKKITSWPRGEKESLFVKNPHEFEEVVENYNENILRLDTLPSHPSKLKRMKRQGRKLIVPVGLSIWQQLRDEDEYKNVSCVFWEDYMREIIPTPFQEDMSDSLSDDDEVTDIVFVYKNQEMSFYSEDCVGWNMGSYKDSGKRIIVEVFEFDLDCLNEKSKIGFYKQRASSENPGRSSSYLGNKRDWIHFISTPMGGMPGWKRR